MSHHLRLWLGLTLFFIYGFAFFIHDTVGAFEFLSWDHWPAYFEVIGAGVAAWQFIVHARVHERMPPHHPGVGFISAGLVFAVVYVVCNLLTPLVTDTAEGYYAALTANNRVRYLQPLFMVLITLGALQVLLTLEPLRADPEAGTGADEVPEPAAAPPPPPPPAAPLLDERSGIAVMLRQGRTQPAYDLLRECLAKDIAFKPLPVNVAALAEHALGVRDHKTALRLMNGFTRAHPNHADTPQILWLSARALIEAGEQDLARKFLEALVEQYPDEAVATRGREVLKSLAGGAASTDNPAV